MGGQAADASAGARRMLPARPGTRPEEGAATTPRVRGDRCREAAPWIGPLPLVRQLSPNGTMAGAPRQALNWRSTTTSPWEETSRSAKQLRRLTDDPGRRTNCADRLRLHTGSADPFGGSSSQSSAEHSCSAGTTPTSISTAPERDRLLGVVGRVGGCGSRSLRTCSRAVRSRRRGGADHLTPRLRLGAPVRCRGGDFGLCPEVPELCALSCVHDMTEQSVSGVRDCTQGAIQVASAVLSPCSALR